MEKECMNEVIALETKKKRKREVLSYNKTIISYYIGLQVTEICIFAFFREEWVQQLKLRLSFCTSTRTELQSLMERVSEFLLAPKI